MTREIILSEETKGLVNALVDLNRVEESVYSYVRRTFSEKDSLEDETGSDIVKATDNLRDRIFYYLKDRVVDGTNKISEGSVVL